jgi:hypothetical protein
MNQIQWVDFKLENVLVSLHSLKTMGLAPFGASAPLFLRNGELLGHSPILNFYVLLFFTLSLDCLFLIALSVFSNAYLNVFYCLRNW